MGSLLRVAGSGFKNTIILKPQKIPSLTNWGFFAVSTTPQHIYETAKNRGFANPRFLAVSTTPDTYMKPQKNPRVVNRVIFGGFAQLCNFCSYVNGLKNVLHYNNCYKHQLSRFNSLMALVVIYTSPTSAVLKSRIGITRHVTYALAISLTTHPTRTRSAPVLRHSPHRDLRRSSHQ